MLGFGLRSASGDSGVEGGEERLAEQSRSGTPAAEPQTEDRRSGVVKRGMGRPVALKRRNPRVGHGGIKLYLTNSQ